MSDSLIGTVIHGFRVEKKLGEGGMGTVYAARHESLPIHKVVKVLLPVYSNHAQVRARFLREAEAVATMDHPHVITVDNFGTLPSGELFLMMPLLIGRALDEYLQSAGKIGAHHALQIAAQVGSALQHAHARGIIHRDLKPGNIFIERKTGRDSVKLLDFGIAKDANATGARTRTGMTIGTPHYMACEQYDDAGAVTAAADVFALAIVLIEMLTGQMPWGVHDQNVLYFRQKTEAPTFGPEVPRAWIPALSAALSPDPSRRPPTARALLIDLASTLDARPPLWPTGAEVLRDAAPDLVRHATPEDATVRKSGNPIAPPITTTQGPRPLSTLSASNGVVVRSEPPRKSRRGSLVLIGMLTAAIAGAGIAFVASAALRGDRSSAQPSLPEPPPPPSLQAPPRLSIPDAAVASSTPPVTNADAAVDAGNVDAATRRPRQDAAVAPRRIDAASIGVPADAAGRQGVVWLAVQPSTGALVSTESCGAADAAALELLVKKAPRIEVDGAPIALTIDGKRLAASRNSSSSGSYVVGFFSQADDRVVAVSVHGSDAAATFVTVEIFRYVPGRAADCLDKWRGQARKIQ